MTAVRIQSTAAARNESDLHVSDGVTFTQAQKPGSQVLSSQQARAWIPDVMLLVAGGLVSAAERALFTLSFCTMDIGQRDRSQNWEGTNKALHGSGGQDREIQHRLQPPSPGGQEDRVLEA